MKPAATDPLLKPVRRRDRPRTVTGVFFVMCMVVLLGAFASRNNLLYWFVGMALGAVLAHGFTAGPPMMRILLGGIDLPAMIERGRSATARIEVVSTNRIRTARAIKVELELVGSDGHRHIARAGLTAVGPGQRFRVPIDLTLERRGAYELAAVRLKTTFPFGLSTKELVFHPAGRLVCAPSDSGIADAERRLLQRSAAQHAADTDLGDIREYVRGDPRRLIAWRATARARRPLVRDLQVNRSRRLWIRCRAESSALAGREPKAEAMLDRAAAIGKHAAELSYHVGVLHEQSGTRAMDVAGLRWMVTLAELGDRAGDASGPGPKPGDLIVDVAPGGSSLEGLA